MEGDSTGQEKNCGNIFTQRKEMQVVESEKSEVKRISSSNPRRKLFKIVLLCLGLIDLPAAIALIVLGALHYHRCSVIAPLFLILGGCSCVLLQPLLVLNLVCELKGKWTCGHILSLVLLILKFGCYIAGALIAWLFWDWYTCNHQLFYPAAILAPLCAVISVIQYFVVTKL